MPKNKPEDANTQVLAEINDQPKALNELIGFYTRPDGLHLLGSISANGPVLFTGMGASFHAAQVAAELCCAEGIHARAVETCDLLAWTDTLLGQFDPILYFSQSGESGEVESLLARVPGARLVAVTNAPDSRLGRTAAVTLPLLAGSEQWVASKTYLNSLALAWLIAANLQNGTAADAGFIKDSLAAVRRRLQVIVEAGESLMQRWQALVEGADRFILLGSDLQAVSARQASLMLAEWAKMHSTAHSFGSFKHGFVELLEKGSTVLAFQSSAFTSEYDEGTLGWMEALGANVIRVVDGFPQVGAPAPQNITKIEYGLTPVLDAVAAQLLAVQLAKANGRSGFRYLSKIVK